MGTAALDPLSRWGGELLRLPDVVFAAPERVWLAAPLAVVLLLAPLVRRNRSRGAALALLLRAAALGALLALLLEPRVEERETRTGRLVVLADISPSVGDTGLARAEDYLAGTQAPFDLVAFGAAPALRGEAVREASLEPDPRMATDIAAALRVAAVRAGPGEPLRIVLLSDGRATRPGAEQAALRLRSRAAELFAFAIPGEAATAAPSFTAERLEVPPRNERTAPFAVRALVRASAAAPATAALFVDGERVGVLDAELVEGENEIRFGNVSLAPGRHEVQVLVAGDASADDNLAGAEVEVPGVPRVLCLAGADRPSLVAMALAKQGLEVDVRAAAAMPDLSTYDAVVILPDAPVQDLEERAGALSEFVLRQGGGLLAIGGREGPGLARLAGSPVAFLLPLEVEPRTAPTRPQPETEPEPKPRTEIVEEEREAFPITLCLVVDRSGSMEASFKLRQAKVAALAAAASLTPEDRMALLAFGDSAEVVLPPSPARDDLKVGAAVASLSSAGHTAMFAALSLAREVMREEKTPIRHVVLAWGIGRSAAPWDTRPARVPPVPSSPLAGRRAPPPRLAHR